MLQPGELSPVLVPIYELELSLGNAVVRVDRNAWSSCQLSVVMRDPLHFDAIAQRLTLPPSEYETYELFTDAEAPIRSNPAVPAT